MKVHWIAIAATFAALPGLSTFVTELGAPPGWQNVFSALLVVVGCLTLGALYVWRALLRKIPRRRVASVAIAICFVGLLLAIFYFSTFYTICLVTSTKGSFRESPVYFPFGLTGEVRKMVDIKGSRVAIVDTYGPAIVSQKLQEMPGAAVDYFVTDATLLLWYSFTIMAFTSAFGLLGFYENDLETPE